jgi:hypothetical protein
VAVKWARNAVPHAALNGFGREARRHSPTTLNNALDQLPSTIMNRGASW